MRLFNIIFEAADSLASNARRALLAALGLFVGVASVICVIAAGKGLEGIIKKEMGAFGRPTSMQIRPNFGSLYAYGQTMRPETITMEDMEEFRSLTDLISGVSPIEEFQFTIRNGGRSRVARLMCVSSDYFAMEKMNIDRGRVFNPEDDKTLRRAAILGADIAEKLFGLPGELDYRGPLGERIEVGTFGEVEVIGILQREPPPLMQGFTSYDSTNNGTIFIPFSAVSRFGGAAYIQDLRVEAVSEDKVEEAEQAVLSILKIKHGLWDGENKFEVQLGKDSLNEVASMVNLVTVFISIVAGISLVVAGIGVMNVMLISVKERTREIGTRKALGARDEWIGRQFLIESLAVCIAGGAAGVLLAASAAAIVSHFTGWSAFVPAGAVPIAIALSVVTALAFGWLPARRAVKLDPCEALRYE